MIYMSMMVATLREKINLTHDVFKLTYELTDSRRMKPGQFITLILPEIWGRSYSILELNDKIAVLIVKRWSIEEWGRGGSIMLCDAEIWTDFKCVGPAGHFVLTEGDKPRLFIGTGTGFVPLYNQIIWALERWDTKPVSLVFGVRTMSDNFYSSELMQLKQKHPNFMYSRYLSRQDAIGFLRGYVTNFLNENVVKNFEEFYLCWAPEMIESTIAKLKEFWVHDDHIFFESYN